MRARCSLARIMIDNRRDPLLASARQLYDALEDLRDKVRDHCPVIPDGVDICLTMADVALIKARRKTEQQ